MELYKLIEGKLTQAPINLEWVENDVTCCETPSTEPTLKAHGWKPKETSEIPTIEWNEQLKANYSENETTIFESYMVKPLSSLRQTYLDSLLVELNRALENDFTWSGHVVKLSKENQGDYDAAEARFNKNPELIPLVHYTFKDKSIKYFMKDLNEITAFSKESFIFVCQCLTKYRDEELKVSLMSASELYDYVKAL